MPPLVFSRPRLLHAPKEARTRFLWRPNQLVSLKLLILRMSRRCSAFQEREIAVGRGILQWQRYHRLLEPRRSIQATGQVGNPRCPKATSQVVLRRYNDRVEYHCQHSFAGCRLPQNTFGCRVTTRSRQLPRREGFQPYWRDYEVKVWSCCDPRTILNRTGYQNQQWPRSGHAVTRRWYCDGHYQTEMLPHPSCHDAGWPLKAFSRPPRQSTPVCSFLASTQHPTRALLVVAGRPSHHPGH